MIKTYSKIQLVIFGLKVIKIKIDYLKDDFSNELFT